MHPPFLQPCWSANLQRFRGDFNGPQVLVEVVNRSPEASKRALVTSRGLAILGEWLQEAAATGVLIFRV